MYNALVNSQLSYAISVWGGSGSGDKLKPLFILQKRALRNIFSVKRVSTYIKGHTKSVFQKQKILTVYNVYNYMTVLSFGKVIKMEEPEFLYNILKLNSQNRRNMVYLPLFKLNSYQNSFCYQAPKLWNMLASSPKYCNEITNAPTLSSMKSRLKSFLLNMQSYGNKNDWIDTNKQISCYINAIKADPYYKAMAL